MKIFNDKIRSVKQFTEDAGQSVGQFTTKTVDVATNRPYQKVYATKRGIIPILFK